MRLGVTLFCLIAVATSTLLKSDRSLASDAQGELELLEIKSSVFGNTRKLRVWLPDDYHSQDNKTRRYPVLYLNDGQDLFDTATAILGTEEWRVDETVGSLILDGSIPMIIVVGIDNAGRAGRPNEYLPYPDEFLSPPEPSPRGDQYASFLESEVIPVIEEEFRVKKGSDSRTLGGSSYGALIALHVAVTRPNLFTSLLLESPSFYVDNDHVLRDAAAATLNLDKVYLGVGTNELAVDGCAEHPGNIEAVNGVRHLSEILLHSGMQPDQLHVVIERCAVHSQLAWARRLPIALRFLFGNQIKSANF